MPDNKERDVFADTLNVISAGCFSIAIFLGVLLVLIFLAVHFGLAQVQ